MPLREVVSALNGPCGSLLLHTLFSFSIHLSGIKSAGFPRGLLRSAQATPWQRSPSLKPEPPAPPPPPLTIFCPHGLTSMDEHLGLISCTTYVANKAHTQTYTHTPESNFQCIAGTLSCARMYRMYSRCVCVGVGRKIDRHSPLEDPVQVCTCTYARVTQRCAILFI